MFTTKYKQLLMNCSPKTFAFKLEWSKYCWWSAWSGASDATNTVRYTYTAQTNIMPGCHSGSYSRNQNAISGALILITTVVNTAHLGQFMECSRRKTPYVIRLAVECGYWHIGSHYMYSVCRMQTLAYRTFSCYQNAGIGLSDVTR